MKWSLRRERNAKAGAREEGGKETPARKSLFSPSRLIIMYAKKTATVNDLAVNACLCTDYLLH